MSRGFLGHDVIVTLNLFLRTQAENKFSMTKAVRGFTLWLAGSLFYYGADRLNGSFIFFDFKKLGESYF